MLLKYCDKSVRLYSIEMSNDNDVQYGIRDLQNTRNLSLCQGNSFQVVPDVLSRIPAHTPVALLIDGPKGKDALELAIASCSRFPNIKAVFIHDMKKLSKGRASTGRFLLDKCFERFYCTDDMDFVNMTSSLDSASFANAKRKPHYSLTTTPRYHRYYFQDSYGPTLAIIFPTYRDIHLFRESRRSTRRILFLLLKKFIYRLKSISSFDPNVILKRAK